MPISRHYHILSNNRSNSKCIIQTIMTEINEEEEYLIDNLKDKNLILNRGDRTFEISGRQIYCYGEVDFHNEDDCETIDNFKFLDYLNEVGIHIYSGYNYDKHSCTSPKRHPLRTETWSPLFLAKFAHAALGKPNRILLFSQNKL